MGYTHYWDRPKSINKRDMEQIVGDFLKVSLEFNGKFLLGGGAGNGGNPTLTVDEVNFNGINDYSHENFYFTRMKAGEFLLCKTARKPYDLAVTCFLLIAKKHLKNRIHISTDGDTEDWQPAIDVCSHMLGYEYKKFEITEKNHKLRYRFWE